MTDFMTEDKPTAHSKIGASSMYRWSKCPGSVKLCAQVPSQTSVYAAEGTLAHEVVAHYEELGHFPRDASEEMKENALIFSAATNENTHDDCQVLIEHKFDLSSIHPGLYGTADEVIYDKHNKFLYVFDYKYGAGIPVEAENNVQLMYYGLGALLSLKVPVKKIELVIVQPRCPHPDGPVRRWSLSSMELMDFTADLIDYAKATEKPDAPLEAGDHCRFCAAAGICPKLHDVAKTLAKNEFTDLVQNPETNLYSYDPEKLSKTLTWLPILESWAKSVREFAYTELSAGRQIPGQKLVAKRATRKWDRPDAEITDTLDLIGLDEKDYYEVKLKSPAKMEKLLPAKQRSILNTLVIKQSSGLTMVPVADKRPEATVAVDPALEFTAVNEDSGKTQKPEEPCQTTH